MPLACVYYRTVELWNKRECAGIVNVLISFYPRAGILSLVKGLWWNGCSYCPTCLWQSCCDTTATSLTIRMLWPMSCLWNLPISCLLSYLDRGLLLAFIWLISSLWRMGGWMRFFSKTSAWKIIEWLHKRNNPKWRFHCHRKFETVVGPKLQHFVCFLFAAIVFHGF